MEDRAIRSDGCWRDKLMFHILTLLGWCVFDAYSGFTLIVLWICYGLCTDGFGEKKGKEG